MQKKKGISLIVLIITIVVLIILAAAVIISLNNSGIIERANSAVKSYNEDEVKHIASLAWSEAYLDGARTSEELREGVEDALEANGLDPEDYGMVVTTSGVTIAHGWLQDRFTITKGSKILETGDLIQYNSGVTGYNGKWRVLGAEDGNLLILSDEYGSFSFNGLEGLEEYDIEYGLFNIRNKVKELCAPFAGGQGAVSSRSIKANDMDKLTKYNPNSYKAGSVDAFGNKVTLTWNTTTNGKVDYSATNGTSGTLTQTHSSGFDFINYNTMEKSTTAINATGLPVITNSKYSYKMSDITLLTDSESTATMLFGTGYNSEMDMFDNAKFYYVDDYYVVATTSSVSYGIFFVTPEGLSSWELHTSKGQVENPYSASVRAVVSLSPNIQIGTKDATNGWSYTV